MTLGGTLTQGERKPEPAVLRKPELVTGWSPRTGGRLYGSPPVGIVWASVIVIGLAVLAIAAMLLVRRSAPEGSHRISWNRQPHQVFIFCSRQLPATILPDEGRLQVDILDFVGGPSPPMESSAALYVRTCHPGEDWTADGFAARHGYRAQDEERELNLTRPEDIFNYAH